MVRFLESSARSCDRVRHRYHVREAHKTWYIQEILNSEF
jgi:hypothetical protein